MICQSAMQALEPGDVVVVEVGVCSDELVEGRHRPQPRALPDRLAEWRHGPRYWQQVQATGLEVPTTGRWTTSRPSCTTMLGSPDPEQRDGTAYPALSTWIDRGVYDDLLRRARATGWPSG